MSIHINNPSATVTAGGGTASDHALLINLDYASAGHSGFFADVATGLLNTTAPLTTSGASQVLGGAQTLTITTGVLGAIAPITTSGLMVIPGSAGNIGITTSVVTVNAPLTTSGQWVKVGGAITLDLPLTQSNFWVGDGSNDAVATTALPNNTVAGILKGNVYLNSAGLFAIPVGATAALTSAGEVKINNSSTTGSSFNFYADTQYALSGYMSKSFTIVSPAGVGTYQLWRVPYDITLKYVNCLIGANTLSGALYEADANGINCVTSTINAAIQAGTNTQSNIVDAVIGKGNYLNWITTSTGGAAVTFLTVTVDSVVKI